MILSSMILSFGRGMHFNSVRTMKMGCFVHGVFVERGFSAQ